MKNLKKLASLVLALVMVFSLATTAFAATITIDDGDVVSDASYSAYRLLNATDGGDGKFAYTVNGTYLTALKNATGKSTEADIIDYISKLDEDGIRAFADAVYEQVKNMTPDETADNNVFADVEQGYYLIVETKTGTTDNAHGEDSISLVMLDTAGLSNIEVKTKESVPTVEKKVDGQDATTADIGDTVTYTFTGSMPSNIASYDTYYYVFTDTMSAGLTYAGNLKVTVNGKDATKYFYANNTTDNGVTTLIVGIQDILVLDNDTDTDTDGVQSDIGAITADTKVVVTYDAIVNEGAVIGTTGNTNDVKLTYSNNPYEDGEGSTTPPPTNPDKPEPTTPTGETPKDTVVVYLTEITLTKVDSNTKESLTGAKFSISGISSNVKVINNEMYVEADDGTYYRLKDGTYTDKAPVFEDDPETTDKNEKTSDSYESTTTMYKKVTEVTTATVSENFVAEGWVKEDGTLTFTGLGEGTYTITELVAPEGYNLLKTPITVVVTANVADLTNPTAATTVTWTAKDGTGENASSYTVTDGKIAIDVENTSGSELPSTGGIGTTMFYVFGGVLVVAAVVLLVTKKRMSTAE